MSTKLLKAVLIAAAAAAVIVAGIVFATRLERRNQAVPMGAGTSTVFLNTSSPDPVPTPETPVTVNFDGVEYQFRDELSTLMILGTDDRDIQREDSYLAYSQADLIVLAVLNEQDKTCTLLQIDRNTMVNVDELDENDQFTGLTLEQICIAHDYGSTPEIRCRNTANALSRLLYDVPVDNYVSLEMAGIVALNDAAGGVTVTIEDDFTGVDDTLVKGKTVTLMGEHAETFVRARMSMKDDPSNQARMSRHRTYIKALIEQIRTKVQQDAGFAVEMFSAVADYLTTDCAVDELSQYASDLSEYTLSGIVTPEGVTEENEFAEFYPDEDKLMQLVIDMFYEPCEA